MADPSMDISGSIAQELSTTKVNENSDNIRHGRYRLLIREIIGRRIENDKGFMDYAIAVFDILTSQNNPQTEGDHDLNADGTQGKLKTTA